MREYVDVGEYKGFKLIEVPWVNELNEVEKSTRLEIAKLYVDLATSIDPSLKSGEFDVDYGVNNLPYLADEIDETGSLFRIFVPFRADHPYVEFSHEIALFRGMLEYGGGEEHLNDEQQELLNKLLYYNK